ncbi:MAG: hypothetical protein K8F25_02190 [Fimbriimonadaceae bacterium]|nr:hypothetical protein [Alphaproteobacteria bacterium]
MLFISSSASIGYTCTMMNSRYIVPGLKSLVHGIALVAVAGVMLLSAAPDAHAACYAGSQARAIVSSNNLTPLGRVVSNVRRDGAQVTDAKLCTAGSGYVYRLTIVTSDGRVKQVNVNAATGY